MKLAVGLGANLGDRKATLEEAVRLLGERIGPALKVSSYFDTEPEVLPGQDPTTVPTYLNAVAVFETSQTPDDLLAIVHDVERQLGRRREEESARWQSRVIDLDLLALDGVVKEGDKPRLPHPDMHRRTFVMAPFVEVWPEWRHPILDRTASELLAAIEN